jgi:hypothetical protein
MKKKILGGIAAVIIVTMVITNVHVVLNNDVEVSLPVSLRIVDEISMGEPDSYTGPRGPSKPYTVVCNTQTVSTTVTSSNNNNNSGWNVTGNVGANYGIGSANIGGGYNSGSSTGSGSLTATTTTTNCTSTRTGYDCPSQNSSRCTPYHPC